MEVLSDALRELRSSKEPLRSGDLVKVSDLHFVVIKCEPPQGCLGMQTDFFVDGVPVICFEKIQFSAWGPEELSSEQLFSASAPKKRELFASALRFVRPYFKGEPLGFKWNFNEFHQCHLVSRYAPYGPSAKRVRLLYTGQVIKLDSIYLQVEATEPAGLGLVSSDTEIFANWDATPEFEKVHILPFMDTLPRAYEYELFGDYLKPYLIANPCRKYQQNDFFTYQGVQFKVS